MTGKEVEPPGLTRDDVLAWGRAHRFCHRVVDLHFLDDARSAIRSTRDHNTLLGRGMGRSYGDSGLNQDQILLDTTGLDRFIAFDPVDGILECEAGTSLASILQVLETKQAERKWFLPVTPGTKFVTLGGAIANDVHGKNHHRTGCFGSHVLSLQLLRSDGTLLTCSPNTNQDLFKATIGGLGLTGLILSARIKLHMVPGFFVEVEDIRYNNLQEFYELSDRSLGDWEHTVAWVDCLATGASVGRGVFSRARHVESATSGQRLAQNLSQKSRLSIPVDLPGFILNRHSIGVFNAFLWHKAHSKPKRRIVHYDKVLYPLDAIGKWNLMYGRRGFYQYQCAVPQSTATAAVRTLLETVSDSKEGSFLAVLKTFGDRPSPGMLSFPLSGATLALDFPNRGRTTLDLLDRLDRITIDAGGRIYPAKDGRVSSEAFQKGYSTWREFSSFVDPKFSSSFWRRVSAVSPPPQN